jgi:hypothetical protein
MQDVIQLEYLALVLATPLLRAGRARALAVVGAISAGLALAALRAGPEGAAVALPEGFLAVEAALLTGGAILGLAAAALGGAAGRGSPWTMAGAALAAIGGLGLALNVMPYLRAASLVPLAVAVVITAAAGLMLAWLGTRIGRSPVSPHDFLLPPRGLALMGIGALMATVSPWADLILMGAVVAAVGGWTCTRAGHARRLPVAPVLTIALVPAWWLMRTIAGPEGLATGSLPDLPWSPAAERLLAALLLVAAWAMSGLWPLHREEPGALTAPVAALLLARVALPAFPDGLEHWRALVLPLVLAGAMHGVLTGNRLEVLVSLAWVGLATAMGGGQAGAGLVLLGGMILVAAERLRPRVEVVPRLIAALAVGMGALRVTEAGLRTEVVYTVCAVAGLVVAAGRWTSAQASTASAVSATAPSA